MATFVNDWTGSSSQRRMQGVCLPPKASGPIQCDWIPAGTPVLIRPKRGTSDQWKRHVTRIDLKIQDTVKRAHGSVLFAEGNWVVSVAMKYVRPAHEFNGS